MSIHNMQKMKEDGGAGRKAQESQRYVADLEAQDQEELLQNSNRFQDACRSSDSTDKYHFYNQSHRDNGEADGYKDNDSCRGVAADRQDGSGGHQEELHAEADLADQRESIAQEMASERRARRRRGAPQRPGAQDRAEAEMETGTDFNTREQHKSYA